MRKKVILIIILLILSAVIWQSRSEIGRFFRHLPQAAQNAAKSIEQNPVVANIAQDIAKEVSAPPPLALTKQQGAVNPSLSASGIIVWTNIERKQNGNLPALKENSKLDQAARLKVQDMFAQQYFEHINPQGVGPAGLAAQVHYEYVAIGENLALGNFKDDQALLQAWMNSPGHRANILNPKYLEMGAATAKGLYQGQETWLSVQEFGKPASSCPVVDQSLKPQIDSYNQEIKNLQQHLTALKSQLDNSHPQTQQEYDAYNQLVAQYNALIKDYNNRIDIAKQLVNTYNAEVQAYNACAV